MDPEREQALRASTHAAAERMAREVATATGRCGEHYAHGLAEKWCDRRIRHEGPCSGQLLRS